MSDALCVDTLHAGSIGGPGVAALWVVGLRTLRLVVAVSEDASPLLHRLLVIGRAQSGVRAAVVDLHLGACAVVGWVHVENNVRPRLRCCCRLTIGACVVPRVNATRRRYEAACADTRVYDSGLEHVGICRSKDVLGHALVH